MQYFKEEQRFRQPWIWTIMLLSLVASLVIFGYALIQQLILKEPFGDKLASDTVLTITAVTVFILIGGSTLLLYKMKLVTKLDSNCLHIVFSPFRPRDIALNDIAHWQTRTYRPIWDYGGWGIRVGRRGWTYNVSSNRGVELQLTNGKKLLIGSQRSEELSAAISTAKRDSDGNPNTS